MTHIRQVVQSGSAWLSGGLSIWERKRNSALLDLIRRSNGSQEVPASKSPPPKDLDLVEAVFCHREADGVAITYVQGARTVSLWLPRHRAARLIAEIASALT